MFFSPLDEPIREEHGAREQVDLNDQNRHARARAVQRGRDICGFWICRMFKNVQHSHCSYDHYD